MTDADTDCHGWVAVPIGSRDLVLGELVEGTTVVEPCELVDQRRFPKGVLNGQTFRIKRVTPCAAAGCRS